MKKLLACVSALALLLCLLPGAGAEEGFRFTRENFPRMDGSTSLVPLGQGIASVLLGESREEAADLIAFHRTTQSFRNLTDGSCDIVIAAEPQSLVFEEMRSAGFAWELETIASEALVFVVNADNPVDSLTADQLRGIYSGEITNWAQVGGMDAPVEAFQRNPSSGSQVMMEKTVMAGLPMAPAPETRIPGAMGELIDAVKSYDNSANAIGYTVFYYASDMRMAQGLKILQVDGVAPSAATIRSGEYPFRSEYSCCIPADAAADSPQRILFDWLVTGEGQALLTSEGYVAACPGGEAPGSVRVLTDDSRYLPYGGEPAVYTVTSGSLQMLTATQAGEKIYPYQGSQLYYTWADSREDYHAGAGWGFYTHSGLLLTEPVYTAVYREVIDWDDRSAWCWTFLDENGRWGFASPDGSVVSPAEYSGIYSIGSCLLCVRSEDDGTFELFDRDLNRIAGQEDFPEHVMPEQYRFGIFSCCDRRDWSYCAVRDGEILLESEGYLYITEGRTIIASDADSLQQVYSLDGELLMFGEDTRFSMVYYLGGPFYEVTFADESRAVCSSGGSVFLRDYDSCWQESGNGFRINRGERSSFYDSRGRVLFADLPQSWDHISGSLFAEYTGDGITLRDLSSGGELVIPDGSYFFHTGDRLTVNCLEAGDRWHCRWVTPDLTLEDTGCTEITAVPDQCTDEEAVLMTPLSGTRVLMSADLSEELGRGDGDMCLQDGMLTLCSDRSFTCMDREGNVVFRWPYFGLKAGD